MSDHKKNPCAVALLLMSIALLSVSLWALLGVAIALLWLGKGGAS